MGYRERNRIGGHVKHELLVDKLDDLETALLSLSTKLAPDEDIEVRIPLRRFKRKRRDVSIAERLSEREPKDSIGE